MVQDPQVASERSVHKKTFSRYFLLGGALFLFLFHFIIWPMVWHVIILPHAQPEKHQLRVESYSPNRVIGTSLFLDKPDTSLTAYAVWQVPVGGLYRFKLSCDDNGKILIDSQPVIVLKGINANNVEDTKKWLTPGPHFLELHLNNILEKGWLKIEVVKPGQANFSILNINELSYLELRNIKTWLNIVFWGEYFCFLGFMGLILLWLGLFYFRRLHGKLFPNRFWKNFFLAIGLFALALSFIFHIFHPIPPIWGDGLGAYSYLPSYLIYHDLSMESLYSPTRPYDYPADWTYREDGVGPDGPNLDMGEGFMRNPATGRYIVQNPMGQAVLMFPFFLLGHLTAPLLKSASDGFSITYQLGINFSYIFYMLLGLFVLLKILIKFFTPKVVAATILSLFLGTNLLAYATVEGSLSHIYSFSMICLLLYLVPRWYADPSLNNTISLGIVIALIPLIRNPNAVFLLFLPLYGITCWDSLKERVRFLWQEKNKVSLLLAVAFLVFLPQMIVWKIATNHFITKAYIFSEMQFYFLSPQIFKVLFHPHHGLFIWSPILIFSVLGLWKLNGPLKSYQLPIIICLLSHLYIVSSWYVWYYGWSFGHRAFVDALGMFVLPLAYFFESILNASKLVKRIILFASTFFIAFSFYAFSQFFLGTLPGELKPYTMTWQEYSQKYKTILVKPDGFIGFWQWLKNPKKNDYRLTRWR